MRIQLIAAGTRRPAWEREGYDTYARRLPRECALVLEEIPVARRGANLYIEMIFEHGVYHADPHPGNILLLEDDVIGLIDFGMIGRLDEPLQDDIESMLLAIAEGDGEDVAQVDRHAWWDRVGEQAIDANTIG